MLYGMRSRKDSALYRIASIAYGFGITPNVMTALGLCLGVTSGVMFSLRVFVFGFVFGLLSVFCDVLDGTIARRFHLETISGKVLDSVADRVSEGAVVLGAFAGGIIEPIGLIALAGSVALLLFRGLSYTRGLHTDYVLFGRIERLVFVLLGLASPFVLLSTICFVAVGIFGLVSSLQITIFLMHNRLRIVEKIP